MSAPDISVQEIHDLPLIPVWELLRDFGTWTNWFPLVDSMRIINKREGIGAVRKFETLTGSTYEEELTELKDSDYFLSYNILSIKPAIPGVTNVKTTVTVKLDPISSKQTQITLQAWVGANNVNANTGVFALGQIKEVVEIFFLAVIQSLIHNITTNQYLKDTLATYNNKVMAITRALLAGRSNTWEYADYPKILGPLPRMVKGLPLSEALPAHKVGQMGGRALEVAYLQIAELIKSIGSQKNPDIDYEQESLGISDYGHGHTEQRRNLTKRAVEKWEDDVEFCQQLLQGVNPLHIRVVKSPYEVPIAMQGLTIIEKSGETKSVPQLVSEKRLFILDYRELASFELKDSKHFYPAVMLVYREILNEKKSRLNVLGIQLDPSSYEIFTPDMPQKNRYKLARMFVACADNQIHEFRYHLGISHLGMEPIVVATHNRLPKKSKKGPHTQTHPIRALLEPHLKDTIGINFMARHTLIDEKAPTTDKPFSLGTHQGLRLASNGWAKYDFFKSSFPEDLKARGFDEKQTDGVQDYYYREDGFKLWHAIGEYTSEAVNRIYIDDNEVRADSHLQTWADEMADKDGAAIPGFPSSIETKGLLAHVLQIIIWNGSAQHSAIGLPQFTYMSYVPSRPLAIYQPMPELGEDKADISDEYLKKCLPSKSLTLFQTTMAWILSIESESSLTELAALRGMYDDVDANFQNSLNKLNEELRVRNEKLEAQGKASYIFLMPEHVACSVDI